MFKKIASEALGLSDIGKIVPPSDYDKVEADDYILHEDGEKIFFLIKSQADEYCFTNRALVHVDGTSAVSKKRTMKRYEYYKYPISDVLLETAGNLDRDVEIKFSIGGHPFSIDVDKQQVAQLADLYKALYAISLLVSSNEGKLRDAQFSLEKAVEMLRDTRATGAEKSAELRAATEYINDWMRQAHEKYVQKDFTELFQKYINN